MANGELTARKNVTQPTVRPPKRRPAIQKKGSAATEISPDNARTATFPSPKTRIQKWSRT
jgi:hypothetical protein